LTALPAAANTPGICFCQIPLFR